MKVICVTGTPGTGKTMLSKKLARELGFLHFEVKKFISKNKIFEGYDKKRKTRIVDVKKLNKELISTIKSRNGINGMVIDSHLSHYLPGKYVDLCIVARCDIKELNKRLKRRGYKKGKIEENLQAEIFEVCKEEALEMRHKVVSIDLTSGSEWYQKELEKYRQARLWQLTPK